jgi:hypothetical protein
MLIVSGQSSGDDLQYLHRGIPSGSFQRHFELADHVRVVGAGLVNGLLTIDLKREIPEEMKPHQVEIRTDQGRPRPSRSGPSSRRLKPSPSRPQTRRPAWPAADQLKGEEK